MTRIEFWPDYAEALLWTERGERIALHSLPLPGDLVEDATRWIRQYDDSKLPWGPSPDDDWLSDGQRLFAALRIELLKHGFELFADEDHWLPRS